MTSDDFRYAFRVLGGAMEPRRLVDAEAAFRAYAACDPRCELGRESYLSLYRFDRGFAAHLAETGSTAGYAGPSWSPWLWFDVDRADLEAARRDTLRLCWFLVERYRLDETDLLIFFSGSKGFHAGLPLSLGASAPSAGFHRQARCFAVRLAELAGVEIDQGIYDLVRIFRAPNSRHGKTGLHKVPLSLDAMAGLSLDALCDQAKGPRPFDLPGSPAANATAVADWQAAEAQAVAEAEAKSARRAAGSGSPALNRATLDFICEGAAAGDRHRLLFSAAANLAEFGCPPALAHALLAEAALDSGLPPRDVRRQIDCGLSHRAAPVAVEGSPAATCDDRAEAAPGDAEAQGPPLPAADALPREAAAGIAAAAPPPNAEGQGRVAVRLDDPPPLIFPKPLPPLPPRAVGTRPLDSPCDKCGFAEAAEVEISGGRTRLDCRRCGRFIGWGRWLQAEGGG